jgi:hypothetical protein
MPTANPGIGKRRGRPRKGEEMSLEDRKARRKEINRLAARRAHQKKLDSIQQLESVRNLSFKHLGAWNHSQGSLCPVDYRRITLF